MTGERPVLVALRALGLGDLLTGVPALRALADAFPDHRRILATPAHLQPLVDLAGAGFEVLASHGLRSLRGRTGPVDVAVDLHGRGPASHRLLLELQPRRLIAFAHPDVPESEGGPQWRPGEHEVARWCRMLEGWGIPARADRLGLVVDAYPTGVVIIHPGAAHRARRWPAERWASVARHERLRGREVRITGGPDEVRLAHSVASLAGLPAGAVLAGQTGTAQLARVVAGARLVVCGDTGVAHLATAVGTPSVVLFGPTPPSEWGPPPDRPIHRVLWAGRRGDPLASTPDPGLLAIAVDEVLDAIEAPVSRGVT